MCILSGAQLAGGGTRPSRVGMAIHRRTVLTRGKITNPYPENEKAVARLAEQALVRESGPRAALGAFLSDVAKKSLEHGTEGYNWELFGKERLEVLVESMSPTALAKAMVAKYMAKHAECLQALAEAAAAAHTTAVPGDALAHTSQEVNLPSSFSSIDFDKFDMNEGAAVDQSEAAEEDLAAAAVSAAVQAARAAAVARAWSDDVPLSASERRLRAAAAHSEGDGAAHLASLASLAGTGGGGGGGAALAAPTGGAASGDPGGDEETQAPSPPALLPASSDAGDSPPPPRRCHCTRPMAPRRLRRVPERWPPVTPSPPMRSPMMRAPS